MPKGWELVVQIVLTLLILGAIGCTVASHYLYWKANHKERRDE